MSNVNELKMVSLLRLICVTVLIALMSTRVYASECNVAQSDDVPEKIYTATEQMPQFPGGEAALMKYMRNNIKYPVIAIENGTQGNVIVQFVVKKDGTIGTVKIVRGLSPELNKEAIRLCKSLPKFIPGTMKGEAVNVWYTSVVSFRL